MQEPTDRKGPLNGGGIRHLGEEAPVDPCLGGGDVGRLGRHGISKGHEFGLNPSIGTLKCSQYYISFAASFLNHSRVFSRFGP